MQANIKQATKDDIEYIWKFLDHAYGSGQEGSAQFKYPTRWKWQFLDNPFVIQTGSEIPIWLAIKNQEIIGQMCALPVRMKIGDQTYNGSWGCDFIVSPKSRGEGIGYKLTDKYYRNFQICVGISMAGSTRHIWGKFNPIPLRSIYFYWFPIKLDKTFLNYLFSNKLRLLHNVISKLGNILFSLKRKFNPLLRQEAKSSIQEIFEFGDEIDDFIERTYEDYGAIVKRESAFLNWRFITNKEFMYHIFISKSNGRIKGYVVVRKPHPAELNIGHIVDLYTEKNDIDTINDLILHSIRFFGNSVAAIKCTTSIENTERLLKKYGFLKFIKLKPLALVSDPAIREKVLMEKEYWFMTLADQDLDQIVFNMALPTF
jgi:hypothetical protein